jgi:competence protein ComEC
MWILAYSCAFIAGVGVSATHNLAWAAVLLPAITYGFLLTRRTRRTILLLLLGAILFSLVGSLRLQQSLPSSHDLLISSYNDSGPVTLRAIISDEPDAGSQYRRVLLDEVRVLHEGEFKPVTGRILVTTADPRPLHYGDVVSLHGSLETPRAVNDFDYAAYLALSGIYSTAFCADIETQPAEERPTLTARLLALNAQLERSMASTLPEPAASLSQSLLLGRRGGLPAPLADSFARSGVAHHTGDLRAASGHPGRRSPRRAAVVAWPQALSLRVDRASFAVDIRTVHRHAATRGPRRNHGQHLSAGGTRRQTKHAPTALAFAAAIMVAIEPRLLWSTSFQLSVLAWVD